MDKFREAYDTPKLNQEQKQLQQICDKYWGQDSLPEKKALKRKITAELYQTCKKNNNVPQTIPKAERKKPPKHSPQNQYYPDTKTR